MDSYETFYVGVNVFAIRDGKLLLGKRKNVFGSGEWGLPGGHLESKEGAEEAAARELFEETGMKAEKFIFANIINDTKEDGARLQIGYEARAISGDPLLKEADRCEEWRWFDLNELPENLFSGHRLQIETYRKGLNG
jgi:8-oxo-dGTP diphosphatase